MEVVRSIEYLLPQVGQKRLWQRKGIHVSTGRAKATMTTKRNEFPFVAVRTVVHGTDIRRIATMHHFIYIFNNGFARMQGTKRVDKVTSVRGASNYADRNIK